MRSIVRPGRFDPGQSCKVQEPGTSVVAGQDKTLKIAIGFVQELANLFRRKDALFDGDIPQVPNRQNRVTRDIALVDGCLEGPFENLANRDIDRARRPSFRKQVIPVFEEIVGGDSFQSDRCSGSEII